MTSSNATNVHRNDKFSTPMDLYDDEGKHWGQIRIAQVGPSTTLQVNVDRDGNGWQEFQQFAILDDHLHFGVVGRRPRRQ